MRDETRRRAASPRHKPSWNTGGLEALEARELMASDFNTDLIASILYQRPDPGLPTVSVGHPIGDGPLAQTATNNEGKVLIGQTPNGDEFSITVHGPGYAILTDVTPNDGLLDADLDTIQLVGTTFNTTVTGQVKGSDRVLSDNTIGFNRLVAENPVGTIELNGFVLRPTTRVNTGPARIALLGGVRSLSFHAIDAAVDPVNGQPTQVLIGDPTTVLRVRPDIRINHIFNTAFDPDSGPVTDVPITTPTVSLIVYGRVGNLELGSATANTVPPFVDAQFSPVSYTGRTSVQTLGVDGLKVVGSAENFTVSRTPQPFVNRFSGVSRIDHAAFGGRADAVALDATGGSIGRLRFLRGLGNPIGTSDSFLLSGRPLGDRGYPASGLAGGVVAADSIGSVEAGPAEVVRQLPSDPRLIQIGGEGTIRYIRRPGAALTNVNVSSAGSIDNVHVVGDLDNTLIAAGNDYIAFREGLVSTRNAARIAHYQQRGNLVDSVVAASYDPVDGIYGNGNDVAGDGSITGNLNGGAPFLSDPANLNPADLDPPLVRGAGFFARRLNGRLPSIRTGRPAG